MYEIAAGLIIGAAHVWSGPDHLAAIAPLSLQNRNRPWILGVRWGIGHTLGVSLIALVGLWMREVLALDQLSAWAERIVGLTLVNVGLWGMGQVHRSRRYAHTHVNRPGDEARQNADGVSVRLHAALAIGTVHGVAGSSHIFGVVTALAFSTVLGSFAYLAAFAIGTIVSMAIFAEVLDYLGQRVMRSGHGLYRMFVFVASVATLLVGCLWVSIR